MCRAGKLRHAEVKPSLSLLFPAEEVMYSLTGLSPPIKGLKKPSFGGTHL